MLDDDGEAVACECRAARVRRVARRQGVSSVIPRKYRGVSFDRAPVPEPATPTVVRQVRRFVARASSSNLAEGRGLWFMGDVGTGKTTLAMLVSKAALDSGHSVAIYSVPRLLAEIRDTYDADPGERSYMDFFRRLVAVDLLHLEDLGAEKQTRLGAGAALLARQRALRGRALDPRHDQPGLEELEQQIGKRTVSRLVEICGDPLPLTGRRPARSRYDPARATRQLPA